MTTSWLPRSCGQSFSHNKSQNNSQRSLRLLETRGQFRSVSYLPQKGMETGNINVDQMGQQRTS